MLKYCYHSIVRNYYYFAIVEDFFIRFSWTVVLAIKEVGTSFPMEIIVTIQACLEVLRR